LKVTFQRDDGNNFIISTGIGVDGTNNLRVNGQSIPQIAQYAGGVQVDTIDRQNIQHVITFEVNKEQNTTGDAEMYTLMLFTVLSGHGTLQMISDNYQLTLLAYSAHLNSISAGQIGATVNLRFQFTTGSVTLANGTLCTIANLPSHPQSSPAKL
jgi:hypothetical protein